MASPAVALAARIVATTMLGLLALAAPAEAREPLDVRIFARVPTPGYPEPVALAGRRVYIGTNQQGKQPSGAAPSKVFVYTRSGRLVRDYTLEGQPLSEDHGIQGLAFDGDRRLYVLDRSADPRVVRLNIRTGRQREYATFADVPSCGGSEGDGDCSATLGDAEPGPDYAAFGPDGSLYVTDIDQALIWKVPPGGGKARVWLTDRRFDSPFGPNGIQFTEDGRTLLFAVTFVGPSGGDPTTGALFEVRVGRDGEPRGLREFWHSRRFDAPDGFAIARSGTVYLALAGVNQLVVLSRAGAELARVPADFFENAEQEVPFDGPASVAFAGRRVLVTNQTVFVPNPDHWVIFDVFAGERGLPLFRPSVPGARRGG
jgi:hypothetical protein